jgi:hypothetical protein
VIYTKDNLGESGLSVVKVKLENESWEELDLTVPKVWRRKGDWKILLWCLAD